MTLLWQKPLMGHKVHPGRVSLPFIYFEVLGKLGEETFSAVLGSSQDGLGR